MLITVCILGWFACGLLAVWLKYAVVDQRKYDMTLCEALVMSIFGVALLITALFIIPVILADRSGGVILFKAKE